ncbi:kinesin-like protein KIN-7N [Tripterygium wilfordii]|uniref:kinesin-like protein KIN-7N n=1 Tax=Tripterygium wilfordii TaxID=458696 RepID=UPI0018F80C32|nr:kinesin-like protein KIN-7N [Tripterygium wilfordii]
MEKICVEVRIRPQASEETFNGTYWKVEGNRISLHRPHSTPISAISLMLLVLEPINFRFIFFNFEDFCSQFVLIALLWLLFIFADHVFDERSTNSSVCELLTKNCICLWTDQQWKNLHNEWLGI